MNKKAKVILNKVSKIGRYQIVCFLIFCLLSIFSYTHNILLPLMVIEPFVIYTDKNGFEHQAILNNTLCDKYYPDNIRINLKDSIKSFITDYNTICQKDINMILFLAFNLSGAISNGIFVVTSDMLGRRHSLIFCMLIGVMSNLLLYFIYNKILTIILYSINGMIYGIIPNVTIIYLVEITSNNSLRSYMIAVLALVHLFWQALIHWFVFEINNWRIIILFTIAAYVVCLLLIYTLLEESPRLLVLKNNFVKLKKAILYIAKFNKIKIYTSNNINSNINNIIDVANNVSRNSINNNSFYNSNKVKTINKSNKHFNCNIVNNLETDAVILEKNNNSSLLDNSANMKNSTFIKNFNSSHNTDNQNSIKYLKKNFSYSDLHDVKHNNNNNNYYKSNKVQSINIDDIDRLESINKNKSIIDNKKNILFKSEIKNYPVDKTNNKLNSSITNGTESFIINNENNLNSLKSKESYRKEDLKKLLELRQYDDYSIMDLFTMKSQKRNFLIMCYLYFFLGFVNNIFNDLILTPKKFITDNSKYYIPPILEIGVVIISVYISNLRKVGRKATLIILFNITTILFFICSLFKTGLICYSISKSCFIASRTVLYYYINELIPTVLRSKGFGICLLLYKIGASVTAITLVKDFDLSICEYFIPFSIFGSMLIFYITETIGKSPKDLLPEMLGEEIYDEGLN